MFNHKFRNSYLFALILLGSCASPQESAIQPAGTNTHGVSYAPALIPKSTVTLQLTATPTPTSTSTPDATAESTPDSMAAFAEIIPDTPAPEFFSPVLDEESAGTSEAVSYGGSQYIVVDISEQHMYVYENDELVYSFIASTGMNNATSTGSFSVLNKIPNAYGATWNIWMPNWLGIYWAGGLQNGIHALPILPNGAQLWAGYLGTPISYGCVVLGAYESKVLYDWVYVGTPVEIRW